VAILAALSLHGAVADEVARPVVVELFTSQGCSSCPPADAVLAEIVDRKDVLALGFHVDYWDRLGWRDPLSTPGATARQHDYASQFHRNEVYTPQIVIDGRSQLVGSHREAVLDGINQAAPETLAPVDFQADRRGVTIGHGEGSGSVIAIRFVRNRATPVERGENAGHMAEDVNAVESLTKLSDWNGAPLSLPIERPDPGHGLAVIVQAADGRILGAAQLVS
jgi:hypothetical protein